MTHATVANSGTNEASRALYACGFTLWYLIDDYVKPIPVRRDGLGETAESMRLLNVGHGSSKIVISLGE